MNKNISLNNKERELILILLSETQDDCSQQLSALIRLGNASDPDDRNAIDDLYSDIDIISGIIDKLTGGKDKLPAEYADYTDNPELLTALAEYDADRRERRIKTTDRARKMMLKKLDSLASTDRDKIAILKQSIEKAWNGVFPLTAEAVKKKPEREHSYDLNEFEQRALHSTPDFK